MIQAMRFEMPDRADQARTNQRRFWQEWRDQYGAGTEQIELLGTGSVQGDPAVTVRVRFAQGGPILQYIWGPQRLAGFRGVPSGPVALVAESPLSWAYYNYRSPQVVRVTFSDGNAITLTGPAGTVTGRRQ